MARRHFLAAILAFSLLANAFSAPTLVKRMRRATGDIENSNGIEETSITTDSASAVSPIVTVTPDPFDDDDDDFEFGGSETSPSNGGSNIFSILKIVSALFPSSSAAFVLHMIVLICTVTIFTFSQARVFINQENNCVMEPNPKFFNFKPLTLQKVSDLIMKYMAERHRTSLFRRQFELDNEIEIDDTSDDRTQSQKQETKEESDSGSSESRTEDSEDDEDVRDASQQNSNSNLESDEDEDYDEPPGGGDGAGGGILGLIAGLSGGEDGQSDLGTLLATFSGIIANLSGDGIDLNSLIASGIGLFAGLLSEGGENPGAVIASYLLTSLDTITGGGANNNGAFFGNFLFKLIKGTSAASGAPSDSLSHPLWNLKMDIIRALLQFGTSLLGMASSTIITASAS